MCEKPHNHRHNKDGQNLRSNGFLDIGVDDLDKARLNRERTAKYSEDEVKYYAWLDRAIAGTNFGEPLKSGVPIGELPQAGKRRERKDEPEN